MYFMKTVLSLALAGMLLSGCAGSLIDADTTLDEDDSIRVLVYQRLFELAPLITASAYCLTHGNAQDPRVPSSGVLVALANHVPRPVPTSECQPGRDGPQYNGGAAMAYHIEAFERTGNAVVVEAFARRLELDVKRYQCRAAKAGTAWQLTSCTPI
jgi:hypothetical protein